MIEFLVFGLTVAAVLAIEVGRARTAQRAVAHKFYRDRYNRFRNYH